MKKIIISILVLNLILGLCLSGYALVSMMKPVLIWSDFRAFQARVAADEQGRHVLNYGGENEERDFEYLLGKIQNLSSAWRPVMWIALAYCLLSLTGILIELDMLRNKR